MKKNFFAFLILTFVLFSTPVFALESTGNATLNNFINDGRFTNGVTWAYNQRPKLSGYSSSGCAAYCADYVKYVHNSGNPRSGAAFYSPSQIAAGDVVTLGNPSNGNGHWIVVLKRSGNNLYVAEGNWSNKVRIGWNYSINGNSLSGSRYGFNTGYHFPIATSVSNTEKEGSPIGGGDQILSDGDYHIVSAINQNRGLDVTGCSSANGTNIQLYSNVEDSTQIFTVKWLGNGYYSIIHKKSGKSLDVNGASRKYGTNVQLYQSNNTDAQKWVIRQSNDKGYFEIVSKCNGLVLDVNDAKDANGTNIKVWEKNNNAAQKWKFVASGDNVGQTIKDGKYEIVSALDNNRCFDVYGSNTGNSTTVHLWSKNGGNNQKWNVKYLGKGYYSLTDTNSGKCLDMEGGYQARGTNIQIYTGNNTNAQKWILKNAGNGYYYIINKCNGLYADVANGTNANGSNIRGWVGNYTAAQKWKFNLVSSKLGLDSTEILDNEIIVEDNNLEANEPEVVEDNIKEEIQSEVIEDNTSEKTESEILENEILEEPEILEDETSEEPEMEILEDEILEEPNAETPEDENLEENKTQETKVLINVEPKVLEEKTLGESKTQESETSEESEVSDSLENAIITLDQEFYQYTGKQIKPIVTIELDGEVLEEGTDYTISYKNNIKRTKKAQIIITGLNQYEETVITTFTIK